MADNTKFVQGQDYYLAGSGISLSDTTIILKSFKFQNSGDTITMTDFGDIGYGVLEPGTSKEENISFTGITQNADGTATLTGVTRGLDFADPYTAVSALRKGHSGGALFRISNTAPFYSQFLVKDNDETITGIYTFDADNYPRVDAAGTAPVNDADFATKKYADDLAIAGAPDATGGVKGLVEIATDAELAAGTAAGAGDTTADLVAHAASFNATAAANKVPVAEATGKLGEDWIGLSTAGDLVYSDGTDLQRLAVGTAGQVLRVNAGATAPEWGSNSGVEWYAASAAGTDTYAITLTPAPAAYTTGMIVSFKADVANTGAATLNVNALGAITIKKNNDQDLKNNDIEAGQIVTCVYDGTNFQMQSQLATVPSASATTATRTGAAGSGTVTVNTSGKPIAVIISAGSESSSAGKTLSGHSNGTTNHCSYQPAGVAAISIDTNSCFRMDDNAGNRWEGVINNFTDSSFDIVWTETGTAGDATIYYIVFTI